MPVGESAVAQGSEQPNAVDVDLVEGGVWVTYSNGCIEARAWRLPIEGEDPWYEVGGNRQCARGRASNSWDSRVPRIIRAPLALTRGERVVALVPTTGEQGYWLISSAGRVVTGGAAKHLGDLSAFTLNAPVVAAAPTESGNGYYMLTADGGVFTFGDATFYGSVQGLVDSHVGSGSLAVNHITAPVVTLATTPAGYWLVTADGTVFPFGDAVYHGSIQDSLNTGNRITGVVRDWVLRPDVKPGALAARDALSKPIIGVVPSRGGTGYQMIAADGGIFNFGESLFHGSLAGYALSPAVASDVADSRSGYVILTKYGRMHRFGDVGGQLDSIERPSSPLTPTALPASACRPSGRQGFPVSSSSARSVGTIHVGVLFAEFDDYPVDRALYPVKASLGAVGAPGSPFELWKQVEITENYLEAMSYGKLDVIFHLAEDWVSIGSYDEWLQGSKIDPVILPSSDTFDFSNGGIGYDSLLLYLPPDKFGSGRAGNSVYSEVSDVTVAGLALVGYTVREWPYGVQTWPTAAHELLHVLDLPDLYSYDRSVYEGRIEAGEAEFFGLMGFRGWKPRSDARFGFNVEHLALADGSSLAIAGHVRHQPNADEMLAWHRWRLGWLDAKQVLCLARGSATVDIAPLARPEDGVAMVSVQLSDREFLILENRTRLGWDADYVSEFSNSGADRGGFLDRPGRAEHYYRRLATEGVLAYVVDVDVWGGSLPIKLFAEDSIQPGEDATLGPGESRTGMLSDGTMLRLDVQEGPGGAVRVKIITS